jgi:hypothetical protein
VQTEQRLRSDTSVSRIANLDEAHLSAGNKQPAPIKRFILSTE